MYQTGRELDFTLNGKGFLEVISASGEVLYTRDGALNVNKQGHLMTRQGYPLSDSITLPAHYKALNLKDDGTLMAIQGTDSRQVVLGSFHLTTFTNAEGLEEREPKYYVPTLSSGSPRKSKPQTEGAGSLYNGFLEWSFTPLGQASSEIQEALFTTMQDAVLALSLSW